MLPVLGPSKVGHAVEAGEGGAPTLAVMRIKFFLGENIAAVLRWCKSKLATVLSHSCAMEGLGGACRTSQEKETITVYGVRERV